MKVDIALVEVHDAETDLAQQLLQVCGRHEDDHDVLHPTRTMSGRATERLHRLATHAATRTCLPPSPPATPWRSAR